MFDLLKKIILKVYIKFIGVNFYLTDINHDYKEDQTLTIKYINNCEVKFYFYKTDINYFYYVMNTLIKRKKIVYTVTAEFCEDVPRDIQRFKKLKLHVSSIFFFLIDNDQFLYESLVKVFLDCLKHEVRETKK